MRVLVTGAAGFIGFHVIRQACSQGMQVVGIDNLNDYYDVSLKQARLEQLRQFDQFHFEKLDIADPERVLELFREHRFDCVIHLAAQAGVRYSLEAPFVYADSNLTGQLAMLEACRQVPVQHFIYASSSSVYGLNGSQPFRGDHPTEHPVSLYAATKKAGEMMTHSYSHLYGIPATGLRFFTVYGPWGRPDMALFKFTKAILQDQPIDIYNHGNMSRDFTYIDDIVESILRLIPHAPGGNPDWDVHAAPADTSSAPYRVLNIGNGSPVALTEFVEAIEQAIGKRAEKNYLPMQPGDVVSTYADTDPLVAITGYRPQTKVQRGVEAFVDWYRDYYGC